MRIIGLTGGIASGKSTVAGLLKDLGAYIIDADKLAREVVEQGAPAWRDIRDWLGEKVLLSDGDIDRKALGDIIFNDAEARAKLDAITHPRILAAVQQAVNLARQQGFAVAVLDVPLLFESGWAKLADETWLAYTNEATQLERLMKRDGISRQQAEARIASQMRIAAKVKLADVIIDNNKNIESTKEQVETAWRKAIAQA